VKTFQTLLMYPCLVGAFALTALCVVLVWRRQIALFATQLFEKWSRLGNFGRVLLVTFVSAMIVYGSTKTNLTDGVEGGTTNAPTAGLAMGGALGGARGRAPNGVVQPAAGRVPTGATLAQNLWRRGCWEDWLSVSFEDGWVFPHGTNHLSRVAVMTQGELRSKVRDTDAVASLGVKVAHVPFDTCFYHEHTPSNSYRFTWDRAYIDRPPAISQRNTRCVALAVKDFLVVDR